MKHSNTAISASALISLVAQSAARTPPDYDFDFANIGAVGNTAYDGPDPYSAPPLTGHGRVDYAYRMSKLETSTGQWIEYLNTFSTTAASIPFWKTTGMTFWGGERVTGETFRLRDIPNAARLPVPGISWRMAAMYCNWLQNGKSADPASLATGAYDRSTWGNRSDGSLLDSPTHLPGANYWIPTFDEQLKAFQYDPDRNGPGNGGWWTARNKSDQPGIPGPPGVGTTSAGWDDDSAWVPWNVPLGAYTSSLSPWGLFDTSGGTQEWNEALYPEENPFGQLPNEQGWQGAPAGFYPISYRDYAWDAGSSKVTGNGYTGLRLASAIPSPGGLIAVSFSCCSLLFRARHRKKLP